MRRERRRDEPEGRATPPTSYTEYATPSEAMAALGLGNGGETDQWMNGLSKAENKAVYDYSGDAYEELNAALREGRDFKKTDDYGNPYDYKNCDTQLEQAINKFTLNTPTTFIRGSNAGLLGGASTVDQINAMVGNVVHDPGYTSTSAHTGGGFGGKITYHINTPAGKGIGAYIRGISMFSGEDEFLFNKGSAFKVTGAYETSNGQVHCNLEYVGRV